MLSAVLNSAGKMRMHAYLKLNYDGTLRGVKNLSGGLVLEWAFVPEKSCWILCSVSQRFIELLSSFLQTGKIEVRIFHSQSQMCSYAVKTWIKLIIILWNFASEQ